MTDSEVEQIIVKAMEAVSLNGRTYPNRLRSLPTHRAIRIAIDLVVHGKTQAERMQEDREMLNKAICARHANEDDSLKGTARKGLPSV